MFGNQNFWRSLWKVTMSCIMNYSIYTNSGYSSCHFRKIFRCEFDHGPWSWAMIHGLFKVWISNHRFRAKVIILGRRSTAYRRYRGPRVRIRLGSCWTVVFLRYHLLVNDVWSMIHRLWSMDYYSSNYFPSFRIQKIQWNHHTMDFKSSLRLNPP